jgi:hypothetical protein
MVGAGAGTGAEILYKLEPEQHKNGTVQLRNTATNHVSNRKITDQSSVENHIVGLKDFGNSTVPVMEQ